MFHELHIRTRKFNHSDIQNYWLIVTGKEDVKTGKGVEDELEKIKNLG